MKQTFSVIRAQTPEDFRAFWQMFDTFIIEVTHKSEMDDRTLEWFLSDTYRRELERRLTDARAPLQIVLVCKSFGGSGSAVSSKNAVGFCIFSCDGRDCRVSAFFLRGNYRGKGNGKEIWKEIELHLGRRGISHYYLSEMSVATSGFWEAIGFKTNGKREMEKKKRRIARSYPF